MEHLSRCRSSIGGPGRGASFLGTFKDNGAGEETSALVFYKCEALVTLRHIYLGSFFMDPKDIRGLSLGAVWNFFRKTGLSRLGPRKGAQRAGKA
jgi:hypothetical protein